MSQFVYPFVCYRWTFGLFFTFCIMWIVLLWPRMSICLYEYMFSIILGIYLGVKLLGHKLILCLSFLYSGCTISYPQWRSTRVSISPHPHQQLLLLFFQLNFENYSHLCGFEVIMVLICIFLLASNIEHLSACLLVICIFSLEKCLFKSFVHFLIWLFVFSLLSCNCSYGHMICKSCDWNNHWLLFFFFCYNRGLSKLLGSMSMFIIIFKKN